MNFACDKIGGLQQRVMVYDNHLMDHSLLYELFLPNCSTYYQ